jgi:hypothetical protein
MVPSPCGAQVRTKCLVFQRSLLLAWNKCIGDLVFIGLRVVRCVLEFFLRDLGVTYSALVFGHSHSRMS